jgi:hypothetical protein
MAFAHIKTMRCLALLVIVGVATPAHAQPDPLPSWNDGAAKAAILGFVADVTTESGPDFVPASERIATFDNDGMLWVEQPVYNQAVFARDRVEATAPAHPEWATTQPFEGP